MSSSVRRVSRPLSMMIGALVVSATSTSHSAYAEESTVSRSQLEAELSQRDAIIIQLLNRIDRLERQVQSQEQSSSADDALGEQALLPPPATDQTRAQVGGILVDPTAAERALERSLVEDGAVLLEPGTIELTPSLSYTRREVDSPIAVAQGDGVRIGEARTERNEFDLDLGVRVGLPSDAQIEFGLPYSLVNRQLSIRAGDRAPDADDETARAVGNLRLGLAKTIVGGSDNFPDTVGRLTWNTRTGNPTNDGVTLHSDFHSIEAELVSTLNQDPLVYVGALSFEHFLENDDLQPGNEIQLTLGANLAASPESSLSFSLVQSYQDDFEVDGQQLDASDRFEASLGVGVSTILSRNKLLSVSGLIGVTNDAPDYSLIVSMPIRFHPQGFWAEQ